MHVHSLCVAIFLWNFVCHVFWHIAFYFSNNDLWNYKPPLELSHTQSQRVVWIGQLFSLWKVYANFCPVRLLGWVNRNFLHLPIYSYWHLLPTSCPSSSQPPTKRSTIIALYMLCCGLHLWTWKEIVLKFLCSLSLPFEPSWFKWIGIGNMHMYMLANQPTPLHVLILNCMSRQSRVLYIILCWSHVCSDQSAISIILWVTV